MGNGRSRLGGGGGGGDGGAVSTTKRGGKGRKMCGEIGN